VIRRLAIAAACAAFLSCAGSDAVKIHLPLGGFPDEPSTVHGRVQRIEARNGMLVVAVDTVDGVARTMNAFIYIDEKTIFTNSGGGKNLRSWEELTGAEIVVKGWYREGHYFADEIDVLAFPNFPGAQSR